MLTWPAPLVGLSWGTAHDSLLHPLSTSLFPGVASVFPPAHTFECATFGAGQLHVHRLRQGPKQAPHGSLQPGQEGASSARHLRACLSKPHRTLIYQLASSVFFAHSRRRYVHACAAQHGRGALCVHQPTHQDGLVLCVRRRSDRYVCAPFATLNLRRSPRPLLNASKACFRSFLCLFVCNQIPTMAKTTRRLSSS